MTLEPGIYDPEEAPWWVFHCEGCDDVTVQWMLEAAGLFALQLAVQYNTEVQSVNWIHQYLDDEGDGLFLVTLATRELQIVVSRGDETTKPNGAVTDA